MCLGRLGGQEHGLPLSTHSRPLSQLPLQAIPAEAGSVAPPPGCKPDSTACECWAAVRGWGPCGLAGTIGRLTLPSSSLR